MEKKSKINKKFLGLTASSQLLDFEATQNFKQSQGSGGASSFHPIVSTRALAF